MWLLPFVFVQSMTNLWMWLQSQQLCHRKTVLYVCYIFFLFEVLVPQWELYRVILNHIKTITLKSKTTKIILLTYEKKVTII
jgi:hypothetical protein